MTDLIQLQSPRLKLLQMTAADFDRFHKVMANPDAMRTFDLCRPLTPDETKSHLQRWIAHHDAHGYSPGLIEFIETGDIIGFGGIACYPGCDAGGPELVYVLKPEWWGQGFASEFAQSAVDYGFQTLKIPKIYATVLPDNTASIRVLERIGMTREGYLEEINRYVYAVVVS